MIFQQAPKNANMLGYFYKKVCQQILSTIAQTGHAVRDESAYKNFNKITYLPA